MTPEPTTEDNREEARSIVNHAIAAWIVADAKARDAAGDKIWDEIQSEQTNTSILRAKFASTEQHFSKLREPFDQVEAPPPPAAAPAASELDKPAGLLLHLDGAWRSTTADDDRTSEPIKWERAQEAIRQTKADRAYLDQCRQETGDPAGEDYPRQKADRAEVLRQSHQLAERLEIAGIPGYRSDGAGLWVWWVCSKQAEQLPQFRRICFLPTIAAQVRAGKLAALEFFISREPWNRRFWTFTSGPRVGLDGLRARVEWLHRKINDLNQWLRKTWKVEIVFRSTELGSIEFDDAGNKRGKDAGALEFDADGSPLCHPHAHCVMQSLRGFIPPDDWQKMFAEIWDQWRDDDGRQLVWDGGRKGKSGVIQNAREVCKYVCKPGDLLRLSPADLAKTEQALHGLHLVQPLGELKREISARRIAEKILVRTPTPDGKVWKERDDWNKFAQESAEDRAGRLNLDESHQMAEETRAAARVTPPATPPTIDRDQPWCRIFARLLPAVGPLGVKESRVVVGGSVFDRRTVEFHPLVIRLWNETIQNYDAGLATERRFAAGAGLPLISVHTGTPTATTAPPDCDLDPLEAWETGIPMTFAPSFLP